MKIVVMKPADVSQWFTMNRDDGLRILIELESGERCMAPFSYYPRRIGVLWRTLELELLDA